MSTMSEENAQAMTEAIYAGRKIEAIKIYRESSGVGLKESKEFVENLEAQLRSECPEKFTSAAAKAGCGAVLFAGMMLAAATAGAVNLL